MATFTELFFGMADAKNEASRYPEHFLRSFVNIRSLVDHAAVVDALLSGSKYLLLGPKGTGKSAVAWYLKLKAHNTELMVATRDISELPLAEVSAFKTGESGGPGRVVTAWRLLVLCALLDVLLEDQSSSANRDPDIQRTVRELRVHGFLDPTPSRAILTASKKTIKVPLPSLGEVYARESATSLHLYHLVPFLEKWITEDASPNAHILILDGLDSIYLNDPQYLPTLTGLVQGVYLVNQALSGSGSSARVVLLIRNDVFTRLELPDAGKMREDFGFELDWRMLSGNPSSSSIFDLVNRKVSALLPEPVNVVEQFMPRYVQLGQYGSARQRPIYNYLLGLTRHTPRDLLRLFEYVRLASLDLPPQGNGCVSQEAIREGALRYANKYFVDAVVNELVGRGQGSHDARSALDALRDMGRRKFTAGDFVRQYFGESVSRDDRARADEMLKWLFFAGAIGNVISGHSENYLQFFHRRDHNEVYLRGPLLLHNALVYAWSIPWS